MKFKIEELQSCRMAYIRRTGAYGIENEMVMDTLKQWAKSNNLFKKPFVIYAIVHDNPQFTKAEDCRYDACITIPNDFVITDRNVAGGKLDCGRYAVLQVEHTPEGMQKAWMGLFHNLNEQGINADIKKPIMERYNFSMVDNGFCEICVPIL